ncbi:MAG: hypothetical protein HYY06_22945 [Deltaproteobacteria bacterium]|nr:hypothetical protein [Deltaproteobacteria bacterium]
MTRRALSRIAGTVWCTGALVLLARSVAFFRIARDREHRSTIALVAAVGLAAIVGLAKGAFVLRRSAARNLARIERLPEPVRPWQAFPPAYALLILFMVGLGIAVRFVAAQGWLGGHITALAIYVAVAVALASSSKRYFES